MVYAMFSIGILGFLVWSQLVGLFFSDLEVINFTISQKFVKLNDTNLQFFLFLLFSNNLFNLLKLLAGINFSSEILREGFLNIFYFVFIILILIVFKLMFFLI